MPQQQPSSSDKAELGRVIERLIAKQGLSVDEAARAAAIDPGTIQDWINGTHWPRAKTLARFGRALDVEDALLRYQRKLKDQREKAAEESISATPADHTDVQRAADQGSRDDASHTEPDSDAGEIPSGVADREHRFGLLRPAVEARGTWLSRRRIYIGAVGFVAAVGLAVWGTTALRRQSWPSVSGPVTAEGRYTRSYTGLVWIELTSPHTGPQNARIVLHWGGKRARVSVGVASAPVFLTTGKSGTDQTPILVWTAPKLTVKFGVGRPGRGRAVSISNDWSSPTDG